MAATEKLHEKAADTKEQRAQRVRPRSDACRTFHMPAGACAISVQLCVEHLILCRSVPTWMGGFLLQLADIAAYQ